MKSLLATLTETIYTILMPPYVFRIRSSFAAMLMLGTPNCVRKASQAKPRRLLHAKFTPKIDLGVI